MKYFMKLRIFYEIFYETNYQNQEKQHTFLYKI